MVRRQGAAARKVLFMARQKHVSRRTHCWRMRQLPFPLLFVLVSVGCSPYSVRSLDRPPLPIPDAYHHDVAGERGRHIPGQWWREFDDPKLNAALEVAFAENFELRQIWSRLAQAQALARIAGAERVPQIEFRTGTSRLHSVDREVTGLQGNTRTRTTNPDRYFVATGLTYELDIWKRIASRRTAAQLEYVASRQDVEATALLLTGTVVNVWLTSQEQHALLEVLREQIQVSKTLLDLTELRFSVGAGSALDVLQQRQQLADTQAQVPVVQSFLETALNQLAVLLGRAPGSLDEGAPGRALPELPAFPQLISPATLLVSRPDMQAAQLRLQAADYRVAAAVAERLPRLVLNLSYEFSARSWETFFRQEMGSLIGDMFTPLMDGSRRRNEVLRQKARVQELLDRFGQAYLEALREIEDALVQERQQQELLRNLEQQRAIAQSTLDVSRARYVHGLIDYLNVLVAVQSLQALQRRLISEQKTLLSIRAELYRALGGKWTDALETPVRLAAPASFRGSLLGREHRLK